MRIETLKLNYEFSRVYKRGKFAVGKTITMHAFKRYNGLKHNMTLIPTDIIRLGFCANKKSLGAVGRNKAKRLMREAYRKIASKIKPGYDIVITLRACEEIPKYSDIEHDVRALANRLNLLT